MCEMEEKMISSVKDHACLYNRSDTGFRNRHKRDRAWIEVAGDCGLSVKQSQCRWKTLRDRFVREYHKCSDAKMEPSIWRHYNQLSFLLEHIRPRGCGILDDSQLDSDSHDEDLLSKQLSYANDESNRSYCSESNKTDDNHRETNTTNYAGREDTLSNDSGETAAQGLQQAQTEFHKVMGLLNSVLEKQLNEVPPSAPQVVAEQDPFYKYLESILSRVNATTRADIQLELLNIANTLVKNAKAQGST